MKKFILGLLLGSALGASTTHTAKVLETLESGGYTYMQVKEAKNVYWIAMTHRDVKSGDTVKYTEQGWMKNFHSKTLNRTFENILFAGNATNTKENAPKVQRKETQMKSLYQEKGTLCIAELFANPKKYVGKKVTIKGKVTKVSNGIMKLNWLHLQDGSNFQGMDDLVFTSTQELPSVGSIIYAEGTFIKDKDFGYGYFYPVIIQNASFK